MHIQGKKLQAPGLLKAWQALCRARCLEKHREWFMFMGFICFPRAGGGVVGALIRAKHPRRHGSVPRLGRLRRADLPQLQNLSVSEARALWELPSPSLATIGSRGINSPSLPATPLQPPHARTQTVNASTSRPGCLTQGKNSHAIAGSF